MFKHENFELVREAINGDGNLEDWAYAQSDERKLIAVRRACRTLGYEAGDVPVIPGDADEEDFISAFQHELRRLAVDDLVEGYRQLGIVQTEVVAETGELMVSLTDEGRKLVESEDMLEELGDEAP